MRKRVLDVGQCGPDHAAIRRLLSRFDVDVVQVDTGDDALAQLRAGQFALVLVNRKLDIDYSDGLEIIRAIKGDAALADVPVMLVSNYAEHQATAVAEGALPGFGKAELHLPGVRERLASVLG